MAKSSEEIAAELLERSRDDWADHVAKVSIKLIDSAIKAHEANDYAYRSKRTPSDFTAGREHMAIYAVSLLFGVGYSDVREAIFGKDS